MLLYNNEIGSSRAGHNSHCALLCRQVWDAGGSGEIVWNARDVGRDTIASVAENSLLQVLSRRSWARLVWCRYFTATW
jgi:hypothetical protein